jgi:hypothetical protein
MINSQAASQMTSSLTFRKTADCPASATLLSYRAAKVSRKVGDVVRRHLLECEFCNAEQQLLAHHKPVRGTRVRTPEIPINLRILAESILFQKL